MGTLRTYQSNHWTNELNLLKYGPKWWCSARWWRHILCSGTVEPVAPPGGLGWGCLGDGSCFTEIYPPYEHSTSTIRAPYEWGLRLIIAALNYSGQRQGTQSIVFNVDSVVRVSNPYWQPSPCTQTLGILMCSRCRCMLSTALGQGRHCTSTTWLKEGNSYSQESEKLLQLEPL